MASNDTTPAFGIDAKGKLDSERKSKHVSAKLGAEGEAHLRVEPNGGYTYSDKASIEGSIEGSAKTKRGPVSMDVGAGAHASSEIGKTYDAEGTHMVVANEVGQWVKGGASAAGYGYSGKFENGQRATYEVVVPPPYKVDANAINPYDPATLPTGTVISYDSTRYDNESSGITFGKAVGNLGVSGERKHDDGVSMRIEKTGDHTVRVAVTQNDKIDDKSRVGVDIGKASPEAGRDGTMSVATTTMAEFDLSTPEGREAYGQVIVGQALPQHEGPGVSGLSTTQKLDIDTQPRVGLKGVGEVDIGKHVDNSYELTKDKERSEITFHYDVDGAISAKSTFPMGEDHQPDMDRGKDFSVALSHLGPDQTGALRTAFGGMPGTRGLGGDQGVEMTFTPEQLTQMRDRARDYIERTQGADALRRLDAGEGPSGTRETAVLATMAAAKNPREVFDAMQMQDGRFLPDAMATMDNSLPKPRPPLPGTLAIQPGAADAQRLASMPAEQREKLMDEVYRAPHPQAHEVSSPTPDAASHYVRSSADASSPHPDRARDAQAIAGVRELDATMGRVFDQSSERLAAALSAAGRRDGLERIDHVVLSGDGKHAYAVQGELDSPHKRIATVDTATAVQTPVEQSAAQWTQSQQTTEQTNQQASVAQGVPMR